MGGQRGRGTERARQRNVTVEAHRPDQETITLHLTRAEAEVLEAQLSRDIAHIEDELVESGGSGSVLALNARYLRNLEQRLRELLAGEPMAEIV